VTLEDRLNEEKENRFDRRKFSGPSKRRVTEAIHHGNPITALEHLFDVLSMEDESLADFEPWRDIEGTLTLSKSVQDKLSDSMQVVVGVTVGQKSDQLQLQDTTSYNVDELVDGDYTVEASVVEVRDYDEGTLESETIGVVGSATTLEYDTQTVDTVSTEIGVIGGPLITVDTIELEETA